MDRLGVRMHGVTLTLEANHSPLIAYAVEHLDSLAGAPVGNPELLVKCIWSQGDWDPEANPFSADAGLRVIGKRMLGRSGELIWLNTLRMKGLQLRFRRERDQWIFEVAYRFHPKKEKLENLADYEYKKYFSLMSYLVYYPIMWYLESVRKWTALHAATLASAGGGIMIGGLGGVGKTTTCVALSRCAGIKLVAENITFTDGTFVYPCQEPIRLDNDSLAMLGDNPDGLRRMDFPEGLKEKWLFHLQSNDLPDKVRPAVLFLPQFSPQRYLTPLPPEIAAEKIMAMNRLTRELDDYGWYASALDMHWPKPGMAHDRVQILQKFAQQTRCFEIGIDRSAGVEAVVEDILETLE